MPFDMTVFENEEFGKIRVIEIDGEPWFVGKDVAAALGYSNTKDALKKHVDGEDKAIFQRSQNATFEIPPRGISIINESGLYSLILSSKLASAKKFQRWVTTEVLPSIRKHGAYITDAVLDEAAKNQEYAFELLEKLLAERSKTDQLRDKVESLAPKALYCDEVLLSDGVIPASVIAKDYGMTAVEFNRLLHRLGIQFRIGGAWLLYKRYSGQGYTRTRTYCTPGGTGVIHTCWTQKGRRFLFDMLRACGISPLTEGRHGQMMFF